MQGRCETGETLDCPSMVSVVLCTNWKCRTSTRRTEVLFFFHEYGRTPDLHRDHRFAALWCLRISLAVTCWHGAYPPFQLRTHCWSGESSSLRSLVSVDSSRRCLVLTGCPLLSSALVLRCVLIYHYSHSHLFFSTSTDAVWAWCPGHR